ncbi:MAG: hypothetical protein U0002_13220 [Thermoanaerobaculia bacterium]
MLRAGSRADLDWTLAAGLELPREVVEWEAFLSLDGGASYPFRLTPHLDLARHRLSFTVPMVASEEARLLLRFGNEFREIELELPQRFRIEPPLLPRASLPRLAEGRGEPARPGGPGVVAWVEGSRDGSALQEVASCDPFWRSEAPVVLANLARALWATTDSRAPRGLAALPAASIPQQPAQCAALARPEPAQRAGGEILLRTGRRNE